MLERLFHWITVKRHNEGITRVITEGYVPFPTPYQYLPWASQRCVCHSAVIMPAEAMIFWPDVFFGKTVGTWYCVPDDTSGQEPNG